MDYSKYILNDSVDLSKSLFVILSKSDRLISCIDPIKTLEYFKNDKTRIMLRPVDDGENEFLRLIDYKYLGKFDSLDDAIELQLLSNYEIPKSNPTRDAYRSIIPIVIKRAMIIYGSEL